MAHHRPHLVLLPSLGIGHLMPLLGLATRLAAKGFTISLVLASHQISVAQHRLLSSGLDIRILELDLKLELNTNSNTNPNVLASLVAQSQTILRSPFENLLHRMFDDGGLDGLPPPLCIITDFFLGWTVEFAAKFGVPRINIECCPPHAMNLVESLWTILPRNLERSDSGRYIVPGQGNNLTLLSASEMTSGMVEADASHPKHLFFKTLLAINQKGSWATILNTFQELESDHIDQFQSRCAGPVRAVGPLLPLPGARRLSDCPELEWLDGRPAGSVVYVSFGSENSITCAEMNELALGLESSMKPFLWVLRPPTDAGSDALGELLPQGLRARTEHRGQIVMGWTDQLAVLSHPAIGAFLTHCGWNSLLEGISCGVPFICWPINAEQPFNAKFIEEEAKCGLRIWKGASRDEIRRVIKSVLDDEDEAGKAVRRNAIRWKEMAEGAVCEGGSSAKNLDSLVADILALQRRKEKPIALG
ncbi:hypothetical protein SUGI_0962660 [Cryptomeria japonica]|uniref:UDP-glycosyltransferase 73E1 n=1 Tax=Cryptomeria japonica TaxID=3369 RepID=UPI0024149DC5|nr:UDP-glycosyltransferase 73E1 [Cryptomeria japonica]GLJ45742.1 hypothetical protein SUGI_0962660 [Cryptomeria japonica]